MRKIAASIAIFLLSCLATTSHATYVFQLEGFGAVSKAMGGSGAALDIGTAALMYNPATLALMTGRGRLDVGLELVMPEIEARNEATGESVHSQKKDLNSAYYAPLVGYAKRAGKFVFGFGAYPEGGLGTEYRNRSFLSRTPSGTNTGLENSTRLLVVRIPVGFSYEATDKLTLGAAVDAMWAGLNLEHLLGADRVVSLIGAGRASGSLVPVLAGIPGLDGAHFSLSKGNDVSSGVDAWGASGRVGLTYQLSEKTRLGAAYTFKTHLSDLKGRATLTAVSTVVGQIPLKGDIKVRDFQMPATLSVGMSHQASDRWTFAADLKRVFWSDAMNDIKIGFVADGGAGNINIALPQTFKDISIVSLGAAYKMGNWTLRGGLGVSQQALRSKQLIVINPGIPKKHLTSGFSYDLSKGSSIDFAYSRVFEEKMSNSTLPNTSAAAPIQASHSQDNFAMSYTHRF